MARLRDLLAVEGPTLALVLLAAVVVEVGFRVAGDRLSGDVAHMDRMDQIVGELDAAPADLKLLFVGNSLVGEGLDPDLLGATLGDSLGRPVEVAVLRPDGSTPLEWYYLLDRYVFDTGRLPDLLVLPFGPSHLFDRAGPEAALRLAAHHVATDEIPELLADDLPGFEARSRFFLARASRAYALRDRVQPRVLDLLIPDYRELAPLILQGEGRGAPGGGAGEAGGPGAAGAGRSSSHPLTLVEVERIADRAAAAGLPVLYLAMPQAALWPMAPEVVEFTTARPPGLLDFRGALALPSERFPDGQHMDSDGRDRFTRRLSVEMLPTIRRISGTDGG